MVNDIKDKVFLITGGAAGIGGEVVRKFLAEGAGHTAILDIDVTSGEALEAELYTKYGADKTKFFECDVTKDEELFHAFDETIKSQGYIDVVVNNAGLMNDSENVYRKMIEVNVTALTSSSLKALKLMRKDEGGRGGTVINIASTAALIQSPIMSIYCATKSAVLQFSNLLGANVMYERTGVRVVTVCFGPTDTPIFSVEKASSFDKLMKERIHIDNLKQTYYLQRLDSAAVGVVEAYKRSSSGGTWLATHDLPPEDVTEDVTEAYKVLGKKYMAACALKKP